MRISGLVPARFLTIVAHLVIVIVIFWSKVSEYNFEVFFDYLPHTMTHCYLHHNICNMKPARP